MYYEIMSSTHDRNIVPMKSQQYDHLSETHTVAIPLACQHKWEKISHKALLIDEELQVINGYWEKKNPPSLGMNPLRGYSTPSGQC